jgi:hypothetical protein
MVFKNRNTTLAERFYLGFVIVNAGDMMAHFCKANGGDESHIP